jgi:hypothetical protein
MLDTCPKEIPMRRFMCSAVVLCLVAVLGGCDDDAPNVDAPNVDAPTDAKGTAPAADQAPGVMTEAVGDVLKAEPAGSCCQTEGAATASGQATCDKTTCDKASAGEGCKCKTADAAKTSKAACVCAAGKAGAPIWCNACEKGYVDGKSVCCPNCVKSAVKKAAAEQ